MEIMNTRDALEAFKPRHPDIRPDFTISQGWESYSAAEHAMWDRLFERQSKVLAGRAAPEVLNGMAALTLHGGGIPDFRRLSDALGSRTGWEVVAVPGHVPEAVFFDHLANRRFPAGYFIRRPEQIDYLEEPDVFHDVFGHVPLLVDPVFADFLQKFGELACKAEAHGGLLAMARLYWFTVEFGLTQHENGLRLYGAGIASSSKESVWSLEADTPRRIAFDLPRVLRSDYNIDDLQRTYMVVRDFEQLFEAVSALDLARLAAATDPKIPAGTVVSEDRLLPPNPRVEAAAA